MRDEIDKFRKARVQPFGVNPAGLESHLKYSEKFGFNFPLLSDPGLTVANQYGAVKPGGASIQRSVVVIGRHGKVTFAARGAPGADQSLGTPGR